jgi:AcrR family transcriptional regulator
MPAPTRTPRTGWIDAGLRALGVGGPEAVRIESLAQALGVTKGGFYWHFEDRRALLEEMLDTWERVVTDEVITLVEGSGGDARTRLRRLFAIAVSIDDMVAVEMAIREWGRRDKAVAKRLRRLDNRRLDYMLSLFSERSSDSSDVEARCLLAFSLFVGNQYIAGTHKGQSRAAVVSAATERLLT